MLRPSRDNCIDFIILAACSYAFLQIFDYCITVQSSIVGIANQCFLLYWITQTLFSLTGGLRFDQVLLSQGMQTAFVSANNLRVFRCALYMRCIFFQSNLKSNASASLMRKKVGTINFSQHATTLDKFLSFLSVLFIALFLFLFFWWGIQENPTLSYEHRKYYYMNNWWTETKAAF